MLEKNFNLNNKDILRMRRIPLLYNDQSWIKLFGEAKDKNIQNTKEEILKLKAKEKELETNHNKLQREKSNCMKMILGVSDSVNNENKIENIVLLDEYKINLERITEEIEDVKFQLETIPQEIREVNLKLLNHTIKYGYDELKQREEVVEKAKSEIEILRERLKELIKTRVDYEEWINETYLFLHGILGPEIIEKIDRERLR